MERPRAFLFALLASFVAGTSVTSALTLPDMGPAQPLALRDAVTGTPLLPQLRSKVVLVSFIASTCTDACPITEKKFAAVQSLLQHAGYMGTRVQLVLVTVDPIEDTPARLQQLAKKNGARAGAFHYATGNVAAVTRILNAYAIKVAFHGRSRVDPDHTWAMYLLDENWHVRYDFAPEYPPSAIARIVRSLADDSR